MLTGLSKMNQRNSVKFDYFETNEKIKKDREKIKSSINRFKIIEEEKEKVSK